MGWVAQASSLILLTARLYPRGPWSLTGGANEPYGGLLVEAAIQDWARYNELAATMVNEVNILFAMVFLRFPKHSGGPLRWGKTRH